MFERFTERARQVVVFAQEEARGFTHGYIGTEHVVLGLLREEEGLAARVLESFNVGISAARAEVERLSPRGEKVTSGQVPFTPRTKKVMELALREALGLGHNYIGTEHILLALAREWQGDGARVLESFGLNAEQIRNEVVRMLSGPGGVGSDLAPRPPRRQQRRPTVKPAPARDAELATVASMLEAVQTLLAAVQEVFDRRVREDGPDA